MNARVVTAPASGPKLYGTVVWYNPGDGMGFIAVEGRDNDLFVHQAELTRSGIRDPLIKHQRLRFREAKGPVGKDGKDRLCAVDIEVA